MPINRMNSSISFEPSEGTRRDCSTASMSSLEREYERWTVDHPNILANFRQLEDACKGKLVTVFLDYDGTLTPIVNNPDEAYLSESTRNIVRRLANLFPTAIISGRGRAKVEEFVQLEELYYAGSHGMDIAPPRTQKHTNLEFQPAAKYEPLIRKTTERLIQAVSTVEGSNVEDNRYCVSVHFRNCHPDSYQKIVRAVEEVVQSEPDLHMTRGRKVLEIRPRVNWHKGTALLHLLSMLGIEEDKVYCIYVGDDRTDEDAFTILREKSLGAGILVSSKVKETDGVWTCKDPYEVSELLTRLVDFGSSVENLWRGKQNCKGWKIRLPESL